MRHVFLGVVLCLSAGLVSAQTFGSITGEVRDPSGAITPNAPVTATNTGTNAARSTTTNESGVYSFPDLVPATYLVKATAPGFQTSTSTVILQVQQTAKVDFTLTVGQASQTVEVSAIGASLTTESASVGTVIEQKRIEDLPLNGRNFLSLVALSPGVTFGFTAPAQAAGREGGSRANVTMSLAGSRPAWNYYTLDGISNTDVNFNLYIVLPSVDALQEFKVQTGIYPAEFGREIGQVNVSTRAGTNNYHGTAYEFLRNDVLDGRQYNFGGPIPNKAPFRQNQYGFTVGGPVWIPKVFKGKDKLFFLANWEGFKSRLSTPTYYTLAPAAFRNGDFSSLSTVLLDPNTRVVGPTGVITATPFAGNIIPTNRLNATSQSLLQYTPLPNINTNGVINRNYLQNNSTPVNKNQANVRIDFNENSNSQWFGRYSWTDENTLTPGLTVDGSTLTTRASQWVLSNTRVISQTKVNEARFGYSSIFNQIGQQLGGVTDVDAALGVPLKLDTSDEWGIPQFGLSNGLSGFGNSTNGPYVTDDKIIQGVDNFSWVHGKHSLRFGGEYRYTKYPQEGNEYTRASFTYNGYYTANPSTLAGGYSYADFMLGALQQGSMVVSLAQDRFNSNELASYIDDTFKITPKLTMTLGLRWEMQQPFKDPSGNEVNIQLNFPGIPGIANDPNQADHPVFVRTGSGSFYDGINFRYAPVTTGTFKSGTIQTARDGRLGDRLIQTDWNNFAPRFGIAYSPNSKWSFRAGAGIFYSQESKNSVFDLVRGLAGRGTNLGNYGQFTGAPNLTIQNFINTANFPVQVQPGYLWGYQYNLPVTSSFSYLANLQRQIGQSTTIELGYNGIQNRHLYMLTNANAPLPGTSNFALRAPFPEFNLIQYLEAAGTGNYNGATVKVTQRFGTGLTTLIGYTWAKSLDDTSSIRGINNDQFPEDPRCVKCDYGPSGYDIRQRLTASILYQLPFGRGQRMLNHGGVLNQVVGGWQLSTIITKQTGTPINTAAWDSAGTLQAAVSNRLNATGISPFSANPSNSAYFNTAAFTDPIGGTYGTLGRNGFAGPAWTNIDFSVIKSFRVTESQSVQFRMEMFNAPNHPEFSNPNMSFGTTTQTPAASFNTISSTINGNIMRQIQFALKYVF